MTGAVVVGVAPEGRSAAAVRWAAAEAGERGLPLHLVNALVVPAGAMPGEVFAGITAARGLRALAERELAEMTLAAREVAPGLTVGSVVVQGPTIGVLRARARTADLLVLGSDGLGPVTDLVLGGIARGVCGHVPGPVVVVPEGCDPAVRTRGDGHAAVVVGDDGTPGSYRALGFAAERARARSAPLVVVRCGDPWDVPHDDLVLTDGGPPAEIVVARELPDRVLAQRSVDAEMVVLGVGDHGWWHPRRRTRPGVVLRSACPVAVVPPVPVPGAVTRSPAHASAGRGS
ncbi:MAG TPA: universal stress protein [Actinomycetospora sp.]|uniref:universal stress protein n=1 Tax=Actinomycetospora sp. TaxID=1872135 RepID=UPI002F427F39